MEYLEGRKCEICGSAITDENPDGVGFGCRSNVVAPARKDTFNKFNALNFWIKKVEMSKKVFIEIHQNVKFRSEFKKNFFDSIQKAERISKKQLNIMEYWIVYKDFDRYENLTTDIKEVYRFMINGWKEQTKEEKEYFNERIDYHKIQYLAKRGKIDKDQ